MSDENPVCTIRNKVKIPIDGSGGDCPRTFHPDVVTFNHLPSQGEHIALVFGHIERSRVPLVRIHSECLTGDVFASLRCDCGAQLKEAVSRLGVEGGILLYLRQEGRGIGLYAKLDAYKLQSAGVDTFEANARLGYPQDGRNYEVAAAMLKTLNVYRIKLLSNNPDKQRQLQKFGITVEERVNTGLYLSDYNLAYIRSKLEYGHDHKIPLPIKASGARGKVI